MPCVISEYYHHKDGNTEYELKAYGVNDCFTLDIRRRNPHFSHGYSETFHLNPEQARTLVKQLSEFIAQNKEG